MIKCGKYSKNEEIGEVQILFVFLCDLSIKVSSWFNGASHGAAVFSLPLFSLARPVITLLLTYSKMFSKYNVWKDRTDIGSVNVSEK